MWFNIGNILYQLAINERNYQDGFKKKIALQVLSDI